MKTTWQKPLGPSDQYCPLNSKRCDKVCSTCMLWRPLTLTIEGKATEEWDCALAWGLLTSEVTNRRLNGMGVAFEELRNHFATFHSSILRLVAAVGGVRSQIEAQPREGGPLLSIREGEPDAKE